MNQKKYVFLTENSINLFLTKLSYEEQILFDPIYLPYAF